MLYGLCAVCFAGCISLDGISQPLEAMPDQTGPSPEPGNWYTFVLKTQRTGSMSSRLQRITGRVESIDDEVLVLSDVMEECYDTSVLKSFRRLPYLSRLLSTSDQGVRLMDSCTVSRNQIQYCHPITPDHAKSNRESLIQQGDKLVLPRLGIDFDFAVQE